MTVEMDHNFFYGPTDGLCVTIETSLISQKIGDEKSPIKFSLVKLFPLSMGKK